MLRVDGTELAISLKHNISSVYVYGGCVGYGAYSYWLMSNTLILLCPNSN